MIFAIAVILGHFSEVDECWRKLYAAVSLLKAVRLASADQYLVSSDFFLFV